MNWAILCPGPSLAEYERFTFDAGQAVAVNGAVLAAPAGAVWAVIDREVFEAVVSEDPDGKAWRSVAGILCPVRWRGDMGRASEPARDAFDSLRKFYFDGSADNLSAKGLPEWAKNAHVSWRQYTSLASIAFALKNGARRIRIYGADMKGAGYFRPGLENKRTKHDPKRWDHERERIARAVKIARNNGVVITTEKPGNEPSEETKPESPGASGAEHDAPASRPDSASKKRNPKMGGKKRGGKRLGNQGR
jgi:hypothetical protein